MSVTHDGLSQTHGWVPFMLVNWRDKVLHPNGGFRSLMSCYCCAKVNSIIKFDSSAAMGCMTFETMKLWLGNYVLRDVSHVIHVSFLQSMAHKWNKIRLVCWSFDHTALCKFKKRLLQTFAFYLCEPQLPRNFFWCYYSRSDTLLHSTCFASISDIPRWVFIP